MDASHTEWYHSKLLHYPVKHEKYYTEILQRNRESYLRLLHHEEEHKSEFWDVIVITAIDDTQREHYEQQLQIKKLQKTIPCSPKYHVISDPPGCKIGCGGSTLWTLQYLENLYGTQMDHFRVLLIHAGGYSKRLPNHTSTGKIFCNVPFKLDNCMIRATLPNSLDTPFVSMLEMKMILFVDFPKDMKAGVFLACADDIELFHPAGCSFTSPGVTALAHPCNTTVGQTHGVFVLEGNYGFNLEDMDKGLPTKPVPCQQFLHKPTLQTMKDRGAIVSEHPDFEIFVDSNFYFDRQIAKVLLQFYHSLGGKIDCEIDAYGDFLQPLGLKASNHYFANTRTTGSVTELQIKRREELYNVLHKMPIHVLPLIPSLFIHIGTAEEYIEHLTANLKHFGFSQFVDSLIVDYTKPTNHIHSNHNQNEIQHTNISSSTCIQSSVLSRDVNIGNNTIIEYSVILPTRFGSHSKNTVKIGSNCILSQLHFPENKDITVPDNTLVHTMVIKPSNKTVFATFVMGIKDDIKSSGPIDGILISGVPLHKVIALLGLSANDMWVGSQQPSLWNARLFPTAQTPEDATSYALDLLSAIEAVRTSQSVEPVSWKDLHRVSWEETIPCKDIMSQNAHYHDKILQLTNFYIIQKLFKQEADVLLWLQHLPDVFKIVQLLTNSSKENQESLQNYIHQQQKLLDELIDMCLLQLENYSHPSVEKSRARFSMSTFIGEISKAIPETNPLHEYYDKWAKKVHRGAYNCLRDTLLSSYLPSGHSPSTILPFLDFPSTLLSVKHRNVGETATVNLPARIILAGGWSDTPPFCLEQGGDILNFAIKLNNKLPITATAKVIGEPFIRFRSIDGEASDQVSRKDILSLFTYQDPNKGLPLHKAAICFVLFPHLCLEATHSLGSDNKQGRLNIHDSLPYNELEQVTEKILSERLGNNPNIGIELITDVNIPKGSGLGTSSILMLACIRALRNLLYGEIQHPTDSFYNQEFNAVLAIEQMLTTGGGWQDQIGGGIPGLKFIRTQASPFPDYSISKIHLSPQHIKYFNDKLVVVYTGKTRLAAQVLWNIVDNYFMRRTGTKETLLKIKTKADGKPFVSILTLPEMHQVFLQWSRRDVANPSVQKDMEQDFIHLGAILDSVRQLNIELERSVSNEYLNSLFDALSKFVTGSNIIGAGSGGFIVGWLKEGATKDQVEQALKVSHPNAEVSCVDLWDETK